MLKGLLLYPWRIGQMRRMRYPMLPRSPRMMNSLAETQMFWYVLIGWTDHVPTKSYWSPMWLKSSLFLSNIVFICGYIPIDVSRFRRDQQLLGTRRTITRLTSGLGESAIHCVQLVGNRLLQRGETVQKGADHFGGDFQKVSLWLPETLCLWQFLCNSYKCLLEWFWFELSKKAFSCSPKIFQDWGWNYITSSRWFNHTWRIILVISGWLDPG